MKNEELEQHEIYRSDRINDITVMLKENDGIRQQIGFIKERDLIEKVKKTIDTEHGSEMVNDCLQLAYVIDRNDKGYIDICLEKVNQTDRFNIMIYGNHRETKIIQKVFNPYDSDYDTTVHYEKLKTLDSISNGTIPLLIKENYERYQWDKNVLADNETLLENIKKRINLLLEDYKPYFNKNLQ